MADPKEIIDFIAKSPIRVSVFGEFSAGKSTFLNALIGEEFLTVAVEPTTAVPTYIRYAREFNIIVNKLDKTELKLFSGLPPFWARFVGNENILNTLLNQRESIQSFLREWTKEGENANLVSNITIELPLSWLKTGIELVDTPGVNNEYTKHHHFTENVAKDTDIAIFLIDARQGGGKASEFEFMNVVNKIVSKSIIVVNKMDSLDEDEREDVLQNLKEYVLPKYWQASVPPMVFGLSALVRPGSPKAKSEPELATAFSKFISMVEEIVANERGNILLHRLRNPEKDLFANAQNFEKNKAFGEAHRAYFELYDILEVAGLDQTPAQLGIERTEKKLKEQVLNLDTINGKVNTALALEATDPDGALKLLYDIKIKLLAMNITDDNLSKTIKRIQDNIHTQKTIIKIEKELKRAFEREKTNPTHAITIYTHVIKDLKSIKHDYQSAETALSRCKHYRSIFDTAKKNLNTAKETTNPDKALELLTFSKKELSSIDIIDEEIEDEILKVKNILSERILDTAKKNLNISKTTSATNPYKALEILTFSKNELASIDMTDNEIEEEVLNVKRILAKREKERKKKEEELILTCSLNVQKALTIENEKPEEALTLLQHAQKILEPYEARLDDVIEQGIDRCMNRLKERQERIKAKRAWEIERILQKHTSNVEEALRALRATHEKSEETLILLRNAQEDFESYQTDQNSDIIKLTRDIADGIKLVKWIQECERERKREEQDRVFRGLKFIACFILFYILLFIFVYIKTGTF